MGRGEGRWQYDYALRLRPDVAYKRSFRLAHWPLFAPLLRDAVAAHEAARNGGGGGRSQALDSLLADADEAQWQVG